MIILLPTQLVHVTAHQGQDPGTKNNQERVQVSRSRQVGDKRFADAQEKGSRRQAVSTDFMHGFFVSSTLALVKS
jgi:hypothetical protein